MTELNSCTQGIVRGKVQHVHLRAEAQAKANEIGLRGWLRNRKDGGVEFLAEGNPNGISNWLHWMEGEPSFKSRVTAIDQFPCGSTLA
jgi:acylphosphatase